jgi:hypothetical protein
MDDVTIRFNHGRMVAVFDNEEDMKNWVRNSELYQEFMYTIHIGNQILNLEIFKKTL